MRFDRLDLNLLVAFDALLKEGNVSGAARRLNLSQSAMSGALARLREFFGDALLVPVGRSMVQTPKAKELMQPIAQALMLIRATITTPQSFDAATAERCFTIISSDYVYDVMLAEAIRSASDLAPSISFDVASPDLAAQQRFDLGEIDAFITLEDYLSPEHPIASLFSDTLALICWDGADFAQAGVDEMLFHELPHVSAVFGQNRSPVFAEQMYHRLGIRRRIEVQVPTFSAIPRSIVGTRRIGTLNRRHAEYFAKLFPIKVLPVPIKTPVLTEAVQWHTMRGNDHGLRWLLDHVRSCADEFADVKATGAKS